MNAGSKTLRKYGLDSIEVRLYKDGKYRGRIVSSPGHFDSEDIAPAVKWIGIHKTSEVFTGKFLSTSRLDYYYYHFANTPPLTYTELSECIFELEINFDRFGPPELKTSIAHRDEKITDFIPDVATTEIFELVIELGIKLTKDNKSLKDDFNREYDISTERTKRTVQIDDEEEWQTFDVKLFSTSSKYNNDILQAPQVAYRNTRLYIGRRIVVKAFGPIEGNFWTHEKYKDTSNCLYHTIPPHQSIYRTLNEIDTTEKILYNSLQEFIDHIAYTLNVSAKRHILASYHEVGKNFSNIENSDVSALSQNVSKFSPYTFIATDSLQSIYYKIVSGSYIIEDDLKDELLMNINSVSRIISDFNNDFKDYVLLVDRLSTMKSNFILEKQEAQSKGFKRIIELITIIILAPTIVIALYSTNVGGMPGEYSDSIMSAIKWMWCLIILSMIIVYILIRKYSR